ncbi:MAG: adenylate/guanylate cyclase domain-containing protein [Dongiaceae bacterium]
MDRRLAAILATDVVGYSRLMEKDEVGTLAALKARRADLLEPLVVTHKGRIFKLTGDGALIEFGSAVNAVQCAVEFQAAMAAANEGQPDGRQIVVRIGIHLGDVMVEGSDLYGDGVNIAARLEGIADPGGICLSEDAYRQVRNKLDCAFDDLGPQTLKNISKPIQAYRVEALRLAATPALPLPDRPSIAVLPFANMSGDPEQEYFSDGITEDIITALSQFRSLFVIARNSSFSYKGKSVKVQEIGRDLGVAYIVEGSVRKAGNRVRVTAQLIEAATGKHIWAEKYDRELADIFDVQDELVRSITAALPERLDEASLERSRRKPSENLTAYDYFLRADRQLKDRFGDANAVEFYCKAIEIDPTYARAYSRLSVFYSYSMITQADDNDEAMRLARSYAEKALAIDPDDAFVQLFASLNYQMIGELDLAGYHIDKAIALNPNETMVLRFAGMILGYLGRHDEALEWKDRYLRVDPHYAEAFREVVFDIYYNARRFDDAVTQFQGWRDPPAHMFLELAAAYAQLDRMDEARAAVTEFEKRKPAGYDPGAYIRAQVRMCARHEETDRWREGYRKAGLPA